MELSNSKIKIFLTLFGLSPQLFSQINFLFCFLKNFALSFPTKKNYLVKRKFLIFCEREFFRPKTTNFQEETFQACKIKTSAPKKSFIFWEIKLSSTYIFPIR